MLFAAFGLMSLMVLVIWAIDPQYRLNAMIATTVVLLVLALIGGIWTLRKRVSPRYCAIRGTNWLTIGKFWRTISREQQRRTRKT